MWSRPSGRDSTLISNAASATLRVIGPATRPIYGGSIGTRPRLGLSPNTPHQPAGTRLDPPMSVPMCSGPYPAASPPAAPPLQPPRFLQKPPRFPLPPPQLHTPHDHHPPPATVPLT